MGGGTPHTPPLIREDLWGADANTHGLISLRPPLASALLPHVRGVRGEHPPS
jgi:hypothetical protein